MASSKDVFNRSLLKALALYGATLLAALAFEAAAKAQAPASVGAPSPVNIDRATMEPPLPMTASPISFQRACEEGQHLVIAAVGDVLPHDPLAEQAYNSRLGFQSLWSKVTPFIQQADIAYANLEGPAAAGVSARGVLKADPGPVLDHDVYTGTSLVFNYNPRIISDLQASGFDILSVANNHALDRSPIGVDRTIEAMRSLNMPYSGAHMIDEPSAPIETIVEKNGFRIAFIACTDVYNGPDKMHLITACSGDLAKITSTIQRLNQDQTIDAVIVTPHWGEENHHIATDRQRKLARRFLEAGASAVIGSHPHELQEVETYRTQDGRETLIAYSLGNFVSFQGKHPGLKTTMLLFVGLTKRPGERAWVNGASYLPLWMDRGPHSVNLAEKSTQAPKAAVQNIVSRLMDPSRQLKANSPIRTDIGCP